MNKMTIVYSDDGLNDVVFDNVILFVPSYSEHTKNLSGIVRYLDNGIPKDVNLTRVNPNKSISKVQLDID